jgi:FdhD protein
MEPGRGASPIARERAVTQVEIETPTAEDEPDLLDALPPASLRLAMTAVEPSGRAVPGERELAAEVPVSISYNGLAHAVMMASPLDLEDFVTGFSLTEEIVPDASEVEAIDIRPLTVGVLAQARIPEGRAKRLTEQRRNLVGQTGCGLCGLVELEAAIRRYPAIATRPRVDAGAIFTALAGLSARQPLNRATGAVHAAAFCDGAGAIEAVREDVGRHNALDKLIGHLARSGTDPRDGFVLMTSRLSFELVQKCLAMGIPALVGISAPSALAVTLAQDHGLTLVGLARPDRVQAFSDPHRLFPASAPAGPAERG